MKKRLLSIARRTRSASSVFILVASLLTPGLAWGAERRNSPVDPAANQAFIQALLKGGRAEADRRPLYRSAYYRGGLPPASEGVCTDLIWRACKDAGYDLKTLLDADIRANPGAYPRAGKNPDPNIDFRRVPNQAAFFKRHSQSLPIILKPDDPANLALWLPGDIVVFRNPDHIAIISDKRNADGVPLLLHNQGPWASEGDDFLYWAGRGIVAHFCPPFKK